jgi:hypothetical protein
MSIGGGDAHGCMSGKGLWPLRRTSL